MDTPSGQSRIQEMAELILYFPSLPGEALNLPAGTQLWKNSGGGQGCICQIFTGGSEFRLATSDYSGHGGRQIGTVE